MDEEDGPGYRMVVSTGHDFVATVAAVDRLVAEWLASKRYDTSALREGRNDIGPGTTLDQDADLARGGAHKRWRLRERRPEPDGVWETTVIVRREPHGDGQPGSGRPGGGMHGPARSLTWLQLDVAHRPETERFATPANRPRLALSLLEALPLYDSRAAVRARPALIGPDDVDRVIEELCDTERRMPIVVASASRGADERRWALGLDRLLTELAGTAVLYALSREAQGRFNDELEYHPVYNGGVRTYLPGVDPAWRADAQRHPVMSGATIETARGHAGRRLADLPRRLAVRAPLPLALDSVPAVRVRPRRSATDTELDRLRQENTELYSYLEESEQDRSAQGEEISNLRRELKAAKDDNDDLVVDYDIQYDELQEARHHLRELQRRLARAGRHREAYAPVEVPDDQPATFQQLLDRLGEFSHLRFTGDRRVTVSLDELALSNWVGMAWDALLALQDFARASAAGDALCDFRAWCKALPVGMHPFSPRKAVMRESEAVGNHGRWRRQRMLPVPEKVDPSGTVFMEAHLRIGGGNTKAPRLHFHDATRLTGLVYLGYLGPHLSNTRS